MQTWQHATKFEQNWKYIKTWKNGHGYKNVAKLKQMETCKNYTKNVTSEKQTKHIIMQKIDYAPKWQKNKKHFI